MLRQNISDGREKGYRAGRLFGLQVHKCDEELAVKWMSGLRLEGAVQRAEGEKGVDHVLG